MTRLFYILFIAFTLFSACKKYDDGTQLPYVPEATTDKELTDLLEETAWNTAQVADGMIWKHFQFPSIFDSRQYINIFDIDLNKNPKFDIPYTSTADFFTVSEAGEQNQADIAINGSYFGTTYGGSTVY